MSPRVVLMNHSAPFLCQAQRRFKSEPVDLYLYHQDEASIAEIEQLAPAAIILARRYGYPASDMQFIQKFRGFSTLKETPIILSLIEGMSIPSAPYPGVTVVVSQPDMADIEDFICALHQVLQGARSAK